MFKKREREALNTYERVTGQKKDNEGNKQGIYRIKQRGNTWSCRVSLRRRHFSSYWVIGKTEPEGHPEEEHQQIGNHQVKGEGDEAWDDEPDRELWEMTQNYQCSAWGEG